MGSRAKPYARTPGVAGLDGAGGVWNIRGIMRQNQKPCGVRLPCLWAVAVPTWASKQGAKPISRPGVTGVEGVGGACRGAGGRFQRRPATVRIGGFTWVHPDGGRKGHEHDRRRCTCYVALHPLRGAAPEQKGCNAYGSGVAHALTSRFAT